MKRYLAEKKCCKNYFFGKLISLRNLIFTEIKLDKIFRSSTLLFWLYGGKRQVWKKPGRAGTWWQNLLSGKLAEDEWKKKLRMTRDDFLELLPLTELFFRERSDKVTNDTLSLGKKVALSLYYLKDQGSYSMTCSAFGCTKPTLFMC